MLVVQVENWSAIAAGLGPDLDARRFAPVAAALEELTPRVEVTEPGCCIVSTRGPSRFYGGDTALAELVHRTVSGALEGLGLDGPDGGAVSVGPVGVGVADGLFAAGLAAQQAAARSSGKSPGAAVLVVPAGGSAAFLAPLPQRTLAGAFSPLGSDPAAAAGFIDVLRRLGLRTLGDVAVLPAEALIGRFGVRGEWAHRLAAGRDFRPSQPAAAEPELSTDTEIDPPADRLDTVAFAAKSLADRLDAQLARAGRVLVSVEVHAETEHGETTTRRWRHGRGFGFRPADVTDRVRWQLDGWRNTRGRNRPSGGISLIRLTVAETAPDDGRQLGFWGGQPEADERAERAVQRVQTLVGPGGATVGRLGAGRRFADFELRLPFGTTGSESAGSGTKGSEGAGSAAPPWPGRLSVPAPAEVLAKPEPLAVLDADGEPVSVNGRAQPSAAPATVRRADGRRNAVTAWAGPWPLEERWWSPRPRRQARFQLVLDDGTAHLCVLEKGRWQREATYD